MLELRLTSESTASLPSPHPPALPASVPAGLQGAPGLAWKRGASSNNAINVRHPLPSPLVHSPNLLLVRAPASPGESRGAYSLAVSPAQHHHHPTRAVPRALTSYARALLSPLRRVLTSSPLR